MAVFCRRDEPAAPAPAPAPAAAAAAAAAAAELPPQHPHRLLSDQEFPYESREDRLFSDILYYTRQIGHARLEQAFRPSP